MVQNVVDVERRLGGRLLTKPKQIVFQCSSSSSQLCLTLDDLGPGWSYRIPDNVQVWSTPTVSHSSQLLTHLNMVIRLTRWPLSDIFTYFDFNFDIVS